MAIARGLSKAEYMEKGGMVARSGDVYLHRDGLKETMVCNGCRAIYRNKRWSTGDPSMVDTSGEMTGNELLCPACQRMHDHNPAGIATFAGAYLVAHEDEILNAIRNEEAKTRTKNPLARIMEIRQEGNELTVLTTDEKLAEKLGRDIFKAHSGDLAFQWTKAANFVRVNWSRQE